MTIDLEAIARRERCESSSLRIAVPLLEQGYEPPFLTRYRRDELGAIPERTLWEIASAIRDDQGVAARRDELKKKYLEANLSDPALLESIDQAQTLRQLDRISKRIRSESGSASNSAKLAVRLLNPTQGDPSEIQALAELVVGPEHARHAVDSLKNVLGQYLAADSRLLQTATAWMDKHVQLHIIDVHDPHEGASDAPGDVDDGEDDSNDAAKAAITPATVQHSLSSAENAPQAAPLAAEPTEEGDPGAPLTEETSAVEQDATSSPQIEGAAETTISDEIPAVAEANAQPVDVATQSADAVDGEEEKSEAEGGVSSPAPAPAVASTPNAPKETRRKISPRQRRRKWLVGVLEPLKGKSLPKSKLTAFQVVMLGRALRSQVVQCAFKYDAGELIQVLAKRASELNSQASSELANVVIEHEASIREALEGAWWDDLIDRAARRLIKVAAGSLYRQMHRQPIEAENILVLDAVGPRTAALAIVGQGVDVRHTEDVPCQLTKNFRQQLVTRLGELVHQFQVNLIVLSNGPARRACMVALSELLAQSEGSPLRWTLAERAGAELYASGPEGNRELRSIPRRFRAAVWLSQLVRSPARALAKVDVSRLRLGSYQRELGEQTLSDALRDVVTSGVCQFGIDANSADRGWLSRLPGVTPAVAEAIDHKRRSTLFSNRDEMLAIDSWASLVAQRQAIGFLRIFGGTNPLDATPIHPDDYGLAEKLMARLDVPMPPASPAGYQPPDYSIDSSKTSLPEEVSPEPKYTEVKINAADPDSPFGPTIDGDVGDGSVSAEAVAETAEATESTEVIGPAAEGSDSASEPANEPKDSETASIPAGEVLEFSGNGSEPAAQTSSEPSTITEEPADEVRDTDAESSSTAETQDGDAPSSDGPNEPAVQTVPVQRVEEYRHPLPDMSQVARIAKEWQVGEHRVRQIVQWLCEPFADSGVEAVSPSASMPKVPKLNELKPGDLVSGVVVGVAGFGIFVELGPDCSGLVHVSRLSEDYIEDLNEYVQIGDIITAWVVEIDNRRRRVSLSGISPERQEQLKQQRGDRRSGGGRNRQSRGSQSNENQNTPRRSDGKHPAKPQGREGKSGQPNGGRSGGFQRNQGGGQGGRGKPTGRRDSSNRGPAVYTTVSRSDAPQTPITDAKRSGEEPLRSFGELMQFFKGAAKPEPSSEAAKEPKAPKPASEKPLDSVVAESSEKQVPGDTSLATPQAPSASGDDNQNPQ